MSKMNGSRTKARKSPIRYLPCKAEPGMFDGELLVFLEALDRDQRGHKIPVQMLVDQNEVERLSGQPGRKKPASGWVKVSLANEHEGIAEVVLPQPAQPVGESMLVDANDLKERAGK